MNRIYGGRSDLTISPLDPAAESHLDTQQPANTLAVPNLDGSVSIVSLPSNSNVDTFIDFCLPGPVIESPGPLVVEPKEDTPSERPSFLTAFLDTVPKGTAYERQAGQLAELGHQFRQAVAERLEPILNEQARATPHETYEQKKDLAKWVNAELRRFDLALKCPKTGLPAILLAHPGENPSIGRFMIEHRAADGKRVRSISVQLPALELMEANPRREAFLEWRWNVDRPKGGNSRA